MRLETKLLLQCARTTLDHAAIEAVLRHLSTDFDWLYLIHIATIHQVQPLLYWSLRSTAWEDVPTSIRDKLEIFVEANTLANLFLTRRLLDILELFTAHRIIAIPYKGPALAEALYHTIAMREFQDLDVLVQPQDVYVARDLLYSKGYSSVNFVPLTHAQEVIQLQYQHHARFLHAIDNITLELHWQITPKYLSIIDPQRIWTQLKTGKLVGQPILQLAPEELLLVLSLHGGNHGWTRLKWICDVAELVRTHPQMDWDVVLAQSRIMRMRRILSLGLLLAHELLDAEIPHPIMQQMRSDATSHTLVRAISKGILEQADKSCVPFQQPIFHLQILESLRSQLRYCICMFIPNINDWRLIPLPNFMHNLYYVIRPLRLLVQHGLLPFLHRVPGRE
jgi:hypothetical protein